MIPGTILISRNNVESLNWAPGHWNHCAIYIDDNQVIQALSGQGVVSTILNEYIVYDCTWISLIPKNLKIGTLAVEKAKTLIGLPYRTLSSLWWRAVLKGRGVNCVDTAFRIPYEYALKQSFSSIHFPDDIVNLVDIFDKGPTSSN